MALGPRLVNMQVTQNTNACTTPDILIARQSEYNLGLKIEQRDLTGRFKFDINATVRSNPSSPNWKFQTSDALAPWCLYMQPNFTEADLKATGYGAPGTTPGPSSFLGGLRVGNVIILGTGLMVAL